MRPPAPPITTRSPTSAALRRAERQRRQIELGQRLHQAEAGLLVDAERVARRDAAVAEMQPDGFGLGDQIADGQHQAVVDQHAVAGALGAKRVGGEGVGRDDRMQADHRAKRALEVVAVVLGRGCAAAGTFHSSQRACHSHGRFIIRGSPSAKAAHSRPVCAEIPLCGDLRCYRSTTA